MKNNAFKVIFTFLISVVLCGCNETGWENSSVFEKKITCDITYENAKKLGYELGAKVTESPGKNPELQVANGYDFFILDFAGGEKRQLISASRQKIKTWYFGLFPESEGFYSVIKCK